MVWYDATEIAVTGDNVSDCAHCLLHDSPSIQTIFDGWLLCFRQVLLHPLSMTF